MNISAGFLSLPGGTEWLIILLVVILVFGPRNLPKLGSAIGRFSRNLKAGREGDALEDDREADEAPAPKAHRREPDSKD